MYDNNTFHDNIWGQGWQSGQNMPKKKPARSQVELSMCSIHAPAVKEGSLISLMCLICSKLVMSDQSLQCDILLNIL